MGGGMEAGLLHGAVAAMWRSAERARRPPVLQVMDVRADSACSAAERYRVVLTDGVHSQPGVLGAAMNHLVRGRAIRGGTVVRVLDYACNAVQDRLSPAEPLPGIGDWRFGGRAAVLATLGAFDALFARVPPADADALRRSTGLKADLKQLKE